MLKFSCFFSLLLLISSNGLSQNGLLNEKAPGWINILPFSEKVNDTTNTSGGYYFLLVDQQHDAESQETYRRYATKILTEKGLAFASTINVSFDPAYEKLIFHKVIIKRNGETIDKLRINKIEVIRREENLERNIYDGSLSALLNLDDVRPGDMVEYAYTIRGSNPLFKGMFFNSFYLNYDVPVGKIYYSIRAKTSRELHFKYFNIKAKLKQSEEKGFFTYSLEKDNIPAFLWEDKTPDWFDPTERIETSEYKSWQDLNEWAHDVFQVREKVTPALSIKIKEIQGASLKPQDWIKKSIELVQDEIRYLSFSSGINSHKPHPPGQVFAQRFGDCKDKSLLLSFILQQMGIDCSPALVNTSYGKVLNDRLPSPWMFNHCIVKINFGDSAYWIDPTISFQRGSIRHRTIPSYYNALVIDKKITGMEPIPFGLTYSGIDITEKYIVDEIGKSAKLNIVTTYTGDEADFTRQNREATSLAEINKNYINFYANDHPSITSSGDVVFEDDVELNKITTSESYLIDLFWKYDSSLSQYSVETYARFLAGYLKKPQTKLRTMPYSLTYPLNIEQTVEIYLPEPWSLKDDQSIIESKGFRFTSSQVLIDKMIRLRYSYRSKKEYTEANETADQIEKTNKVLNGLSLNLTYTPKNANSSEFNWPFLLIALVALVGIFFGLRKLYEYDPEPLSESYYDHVGGWLFLPAFGLLLTPFAAIYQLIHAGTFNISQWKILTDPGFPSFNPGLGLFVLIEFLANLTLIAYAVLMNILLWMKRTSLPRLITVFYGYNLILLTMDLWVINLFGLGEINYASMQDVLRAFISSAVWIPYFLMSDRVKSTFTNRIGTND